MVCEWVRKKGDKVMDLEENLKRELEKYIELYYTTLQTFFKKINRTGLSGV